MKPCPACQHEVQEEKECPHCGVVFEKWKGHALGQATIPVPTSGEKGNKGVIKRLLFFLLVVLAIYQIWSSQGIKHPPSILVTSEPVQESVSETQPLERDGYQITPLAKFHIEARVLSTERYWLGREAQLSPVDFALGWGPMSDTKVLEKFKISQGWRFYYWYSKQLPIPTESVISHSANMHMIPSTPEIEKGLKSVRTGNVIELKGYLVLAKAADGWKWRSSLSRKDTGDGSCELIWVESLSILH